MATAAPFLPILRGWLGFATGEGFPSEFFALKSATRGPPKCRILGSQSCIGRSESAFRKLGGMRLLRDLQRWPERCSAVPGATHRQPQSLDISPTFATNRPHRVNLHKLTQMGNIVGEKRSNFFELCVHCHNVYGIYSMTGNSLDGGCRFDPSSLDGTSQPCNDSLVVGGG